MSNIQIVENELEGMYAVPLHHPTTCLNGAPWKILEIKIKINPFKIFIRGNESMWFRADQCFIHNYNECLVFLNGMA